MDADGGVAKSAGANKASRYINPTPSRYYRTPTHIIKTQAGPKYGTGYCDAQCPRDLKFINGVANSAGWVPSPNDSTLVPPLY
jgi:hypothetical protein